MAVPPSTPRKRPRSMSNDISREQNTGNNTSSPSPKKRKGTHRWLADDQDLVKYLNQTRLATPKTPPRAVKTADENVATTIVGKRKHQQFSEDLMDESQSKSKSEFEFPKISTPASVRGFKLYDDPKSPEVRKTVSSTPPAPSTILTASQSSANSFVEYVAQSYHTPPIISADHLGDPFLDKSASDDSTAEYADDEFSDSDSNFEDIAQTSDPGSGHKDASVWIRKRTSYGIVLAPKMHSDEEAYSTSSDCREPLIGDDPAPSSDIDSNATVIRHEVYKSTHRWSKREEVVFRALVWDYGRKWIRFLPSLPHLTMAEIEAHFYDLVAAHPDWELDKVADKADSGEGNSSIIRRSGHWHAFATNSDRLVLEGRSVPYAWM